MAQDKAARLEQLTRLIRASFQDLRAAGDALHADLGVTAATRAVLEHLAEHGEATVPHIAKAKNVTRQHIQQLADALVESGYAEFLDNPDHKRSQIVSLTVRGRTVFAAVKAREAKLLDALGAGFDGEDLERACETLQRLRGVLAAMRGTRR